MSTNKKTIDINPDLFSAGSFSKTRKKKEKKEKINQVPLISPNKLRDKLLKRIKEHKSKETDKDSEPTNEKKTMNAHSGGQEDKNIENYSNEFNDSIEYLQTLSKQKKEQHAKILQEKTVQKQRELLQRKTLKNPFQSPATSTMPMVNLELPEELKEPLPLVHINTQNINPHSNTFHIRPPQDVPYGILKGGRKPTYREYLNKTQRNVVVNNPNSAVIIDGYNQNQNQVLNEREKKMNLLKEKMKKTQEQQKIQVAPIITPIQTPLQIQTEVQTPQENMQTEIQTPFFVETNSLEEQSNTNNDIVTNNMVNPNVNIIDMSLNKTRNGNIGPLRRVIKKTIRRKYTLGKSKLNKSVAVLLKDRNTRKKVIEAQKDLKRKSMNDVKNYLREHNLIKLGSNAPNDVLRKMYESAMLTGEITNNNKDTLLYNAMNEKEEI